MINFSNFNETQYLFREHIWQANVIIDAVLMIISIYLATSLIFHKLKREETKKEKFFRLGLEDKFAVISKFICILIAFSSIYRNANSIVLLWVEKTAVLNNSTMIEYEVNTACKALPKIGNVALTIGFGLAYLFLWFRQRLFYIHPALKTLNNIKIRALSFGIIIIWFLYYLATMFSYFSIVRYEFHQQGGCVIVDSTSEAYGFIIIAWSAVSIIIQICLLGLFVYPILRKTSWGSKKNIHLLKRVKKAVFLTAVCLITDGISVVVIVVLYVPNASSAFFIYNINLVINHLVTIACFDHWKELLWPWNVKSKAIFFANFRKEEQTLSTSVGSSQLQNAAPDVTNAL